MSETTSYALLNDPRIGKMDAALDRILSDISTMKIDMALVKSDISVLKSDVSELKSDLRDTRDRTLRLETQITMGFKSVLLFCAFIAALISFMPKILQLLGFLK
jgi:hypothetical protein